MPQTKILKVFLGSSLMLKKERKEISELSKYISNIFKLDDIAVNFVECEYIHEGNLGDDDQKYIDERLRGCDISLFLFKEKVGPWTRHEYQVARALQKKRKHKIFVFFIHVPEKKKEDSLKDFQKQLIADKVFSKECKTIGDVKLQFAMGILTHLGVTVGGESEAEKSGDKLFEDYETVTQPKLHHAIDDLLAQIEETKADKTLLVAARIVKVTELYQKADCWATESGYDKDRYYNLLGGYAKFLHTYGLYCDAKSILRRQIALAEELYGTEHENTAITYNVIGEVYYYKGEYSKALKYSGKALAIREKVLGTDHPDTAESYNNIGAVYYAQGDYRKALEYYGKALAIREKVLGIDHPDTAQSNNNIGVVYKNQGDYPKALEYYGKALAIREEVLGTDHPDTATTYNNIGSAYREQSNYPMALEYYGKALTIDGKVLGTDHPNTSGDHNNIGLLYYKTKDYEKALEFLNKALVIRQAKLGPNHPDTQKTQGCIDKVKAAMRVK